MDRRLIKQIAETIRQADRHKTHAYDTAATVVRVEGGTAWVHIPGGVDETPVKLTVDAKQGDTVQVRVSGGRAFLVGNSTAPPTDNTLARTVQDGLTATRKVLTSVKKTAERAARIATSTAQYFWVSTGGNDNGAHVTAIPQEAFEADPQNGGGNTLMTTNGVAVRDGLTELATFGATGATFSDYDGECISIQRSNGFPQLYSSDGTLSIDTDSKSTSGAGDVIHSGVTLGGQVYRDNIPEQSASVQAQVWDDDANPSNKYAYVRLQIMHRGYSDTVFQIKEKNGTRTADFDIDEITVDTNPAIVQKNFSALDLSASTYYVQRNFTVTKSGYTPIAFNPYTNHATEAACMVNYNSSTGIATVTVMSRNSTISNLNLYLDVTYARNELL